MKKLPVVQYLDPYQEPGIKIFNGHQRAFLKKHCHFAHGCCDIVDMSAKIALFGKAYRDIWVNVLYSREWQDERLFLGFMDFISEYISQDKSVIEFIDKAKWYNSEKMHKDIYTDFALMKKIGEELARFIENNYLAFPSHEEKPVA